MNVTGSLCKFIELFAHKSRSIYVLKMLGFPHNAQFAWTKRMKDLILAPCLGPKGSRHSERNWSRWGWNDERSCDSIHWVAKPWGHFVFNKPRIKRWAQSKPRACVACFKILLQQENILKSCQTWFASAQNFCTNSKFYFVFAVGMKSFQCQDGTLRDTSPLILSSSSDASLHFATGRQPAGKQGEMGS